MVASTFLVQAAKELGIASILIDAFDPRAVRDVFGIPDDHTIGILSRWVTRRGNQAAGSEAEPGRALLRRALRPALEARGSVAKSR